MHTDKAIAEFEAWWDRQLWRECFEDVKDQMRNVWLASRRELVIELPGGGFRPCAMTNELLGYHRGIRECRAAIEAAGVTVRG